MNSNPKETVAEQNKNIIVNSVDLLEARIKRDINSGLTIWLKANQPFMEQFGHDEETHALMKIGGVQCFFPKQGELRNIRGFFAAENNYEYDGYPNLSLLLAKNLTDGVEFSFGPMPTSDSKVYDWMEKLKMQVKSIYLDYCKPMDIRVVFSTQSVEKEIHD